MATKSRHLFVIDPVEKLNLAWDTTIKLAFAMTRDGAEVFCTPLNGLAMNSHPIGVSAHAQQMVFGAKPSELTLKAPQISSFSTFDAVHMRKEPPYDLAYVEALWILAAGKAQTKILNDPVALQQINEKLVITEFSDFSRPAVVSSDPNVLASFASNKCGSDVVVKPLNLYGGRGVVRLHNPHTLLQDLRRETSDGSQTRLVQQFEPKISAGEVRAFAVGGRPISWCLKIPHAGDFLANTRAGSTLHRHTPTKREIDVVTRVATELAERGVYIAGFDLIDGWLSEVNITCPALLDPNRESLTGFDVIARLLLEVI